MGDEPIIIEQLFYGFEGVIMGSIMVSQNIIGSDYGSNISVQGKYRLWIVTQKSDWPGEVPSTYSAMRMSPWASTNSASPKRQCAMVSQMVYRTRQNTRCNTHRFGEQSQRALKTNRVVISVSITNVFWSELGVAGYWPMFQRRMATTDSAAAEMPFHRFKGGWVRDVVVIVQKYIIKPWNWRTEQAMRNGRV
jgi:hypothetical protein